MGDELMNTDLNSIMEFDHVITVTESGDVIHGPADVYAPDYWGDSATGKCGIAEASQAELWEEFSYGYTGQYGVANPMHDSEFIGGNLAKDILATPGTYVAVVCYWEPEEDEEDYESEGWAILRLRD